MTIGSGFAGTIDPKTPDSKYLEYSKQFSYVGKLTGKSEKGYEYFASGVAIDSNHILTAAHVVKDCASCFFTIKDTKYRVTKIVYSKKYNDNKFGVGDIAIGYIEDDMKLDVYPNLYLDNNEEGMECSISGFGMNGTFETGPKNGDTLQRAGTNIIDYIESDLLVCSPSKGKDKTSLEFLIASGDSGGGLFIDGKLAGINSCVFVSKGTPNSKYGTESGHTRISKYIDWIIENTKE
jgi:S1-C subfamily serine protease